MNEEHYKPRYLGDPKISETEKQLLMDPPGIEVTMEQALEMARKAQALCEQIRRVVRSQMSLELALAVRDLRAAGLSLRDIALTVHGDQRVPRAGAGQKFGGPFYELWSPPTNQIAGMAVCLEAAMFLGDDPYEEPWTVS